MSSNLNGIFYHRVSTSVLQETFRPDQNGQNSIIMPSPTARTSFSSSISLLKRGFLMVLGRWCVAVVNMDKVRRQASFKVRVYNPL